MSGIFRNLSALLRRALRALRRDPEKLAAASGQAGLYDFPARRPPRQSAWLSARDRDALIARTSGRRNAPPRRLSG